MAGILEQIAEQTNLSRETVARILSGRNKENRPSAVARGDMVRRVAERLEYRPNAAARAIRLGKFNAVALLQSELATFSMLPDRLFRGIQMGLSERETQLIVASIPDRKLTNERFVPRILREFNCDGLLINYNTSIPEKMIGLIEANRLPSIWINSKQPHDAIHPGDEDAAATATEKLLALGHRRIAFVNFVTSDYDQHYSSVDRYAGYERVMRNAGLIAYRFGHTSIWDKGEIVTSQKALLERPDRPTAIIAYGPIDARSAQMAAGLAGLSIPRDLSLITFTDTHMDDLGIRLTSMLIPEQTIGEHAVQMLRQKIEDPTLLLPRVAITAGFEPGASVAPVIS